MRACGISRSSRKASAFSVLTSARATISQRPEARYPLACWWDMPKPVAPLSRRGRPVPMIPTRNWATSRPPQGRTVLRLMLTYRPTTMTPRRQTNHAAPYDLLIQGGVVLDPSQGLRGARDVAFAWGRVAAVAP